MGIKISVPTIDRFDPSAAGFVAAVRLEDPTKRWGGSDHLYEDYAFRFAECAGPEDHPLSRVQFLRQVKMAGVRRTRSGAKDERGKRSYIYQIASRGRPRKHPGRFQDARPTCVPV